jgi:hypothetical protein
VLTNDIELNGVSFSVVPGAYKKGLRKPLAVSKPAARRITRTAFGPFRGGLGQAMATELGNTAGWDGLTVGPAFDGLGVEPFPSSTSHVDAMTEIPSTTNRAYGVVAGTAAYVGLGQRIYKSVLLSNGTWASFTAVADVGAGLTIAGLAYYQDNLLIMLGAGADIKKYNTTTGALSTWRTNEKGAKGVGYAGQLIYALPQLGLTDVIALSGDKWNGGAVTHYRQLDAPIVNMAAFNGQVVIATRKSLFFMGGQSYPGEADDAAITGDSSRAPEWRGDPEPVMTHGVFADGDDFVFLESYRGKLYTWLGGRVAEFDDSAEQGRWSRQGPEGTACYGACVAGDWLIVAIASRYGTYEAWGFDGAGWWLLLQRAATPAVVWPVPLAGAGNRDALLFRDGSLTYDLLRLRWRSATLHTYATAGTWTSPLIDGGDPAADKAWRSIGATFAAPSVRGNSVSVDAITCPLEYSADGGVTWTAADILSSASGATRVFTAGVDFATPPQSRLLQLRVRWTSISDWAPVLTSLWVESEDAEDYFFAEIARAAYEAELAAEALLRRKWELTVDAGDRTVRRDGQVSVLTGRQAITALWDAWELGTELDFKDIDHDTAPVTYLVRITGIEEKAVKPSDAARWGESQITLILEESSPGAVQGSAHTHDDRYYTEAETNALFLSEAEAAALYATSAAVAAGYQPLDADLTAIATLPDPNADRMLFWDDSAGAIGHLAPGVGLAIAGTVLSAPDLLRVLPHSGAAVTTSTTSTVTYATYLTFAAVLPAGTWEITTQVWGIFTNDTAIDGAQLRVSAPVLGTFAPSETVISAFSDTSLFAESKGTVVSDGAAATTFTSQFRAVTGGTAFAGNGVMVAICRRVG